MEHVKRIHAIAARAEVIGATLRALCVAEGIAYATVWRWTQPEGNPQTRLMTDALGRLEARLTQMELAILEQLQQRHPQAAE